MIIMNNLQKSIIRILQQKKECSRKELSSLLSVTPAAITLATGPLLDGGFIEQLHEVSREKAGRKEVMLSVNADSFFAIGIDVNDDGISLVKLNGRLEVTQLIELSTIKELIVALDEFDLSLCIGISISLKSFYSVEHINNDVQTLLNHLKTINENVTLINNIAALAYAYKMRNPQDESFVVIKYGPGVGSACFIKNHLLQSPSNPTYELGKVFLNDRLVTIEEAIGYKSISDSKPEALALLRTDENVRARVLKVLGFTIHNVNTLLQLDKVLVSGDIFKDDRIFNELLEKIPMTDEEKAKVTRMSDYAELNKAKSALTAQYLFFNGDK